MSAIRVLIGDMPELLSCMVVEMLRDEPDIILCKIDDATSVAGDRVDVVLTSAESSGTNRPLSLREVVAMEPSGIVSIDSDHQHAKLIHVALSNWQLRDDSDGDLTAAIRAAAGTDWRH